MLWLAAGALLHPVHLRNTADSLIVIAVLIGVAWLMFAFRRRRRR